jgi:hypothetical protein
MFENVIQVDTKLRESPAHAKPINEYAPKTRAAQQYRGLARELMAYLGPAREKRPDPTEQLFNVHGSDEEHVASEQEQALASVVEQKTSQGKQSARKVEPVSTFLVGDNGR